MSTPIEGQLPPEEREILTNGILRAERKPEFVVEVGTWLGGGSTLHILRALEKNGTGHLWGVEAERSIYDRMLENLRRAVPEALHRFTPLFGFSDVVLPQWLAERGPGARVDFAFLDGGNRPGEQISEFELLDPIMPVGAQLMAHDAKMRKGKWLVPYLRALDHWKTTVHDSSEVGLLTAVKIAECPSDASLRNARAILRKLKLQPSELAARYLPGWARRLALRLMPAKLAHRLHSEG